MYFLNNKGQVWPIMKLKAKGPAIETQKEDETLLFFLDRITNKATQLNSEFNALHLYIIYQLKDYDYLKDEMLKIPSCLPYLREDDDEFVRANLVYQGHYYPEFLTDESYMVREALAKHGQYLEILINDDDKDVQDAAYSKARELNMNITKRNKKYYVTKNK